MATTGQIVGAVDSAHAGAVHDAQLDYYGKRMATASGDHSVHIFDLSDGQQRPAGELKAHEGPVWKVAWAHPRFGSILASCSYDMKIIVWKEAQPSQWQIAYMDQTHVASVNDVEFSPWENGLRLAAASSDGTVSVLTYVPNEGGWRRMSFQAHGNGAQCVSWAPAQQREGPLSMRLVTGGCDFRVVVWKCEQENWSQETLLWHNDCHTDWIRDVAWRPTGTSVIASGGWDKSVIIWSQELEGQPWRLVCKLKVPEKVESLSWSVTGSTLAVTTSEGETYLYREAYDGQFEQVASVTENGVVDVNPPPAPPPNAGFPTDIPGPKAEIPMQAAPPQPDAFHQQQQAVLDSFGLT